jgi:hypothetical protein
MVLLDTFAKTIIKKFRQNEFKDRGTCVLIQGLNISATIQTPSIIFDFPLLRPVVREVPWCSVLGDACSGLELRLRQRHPTVITMVHISSANLV